MQYNGIRAKSFKMQDGDTLVELRYDSTNNKINGVYISKDNGITFKKLLDEDEVSTRINNFIATIQSGLSTPISINLESTLPSVSTAIAWPNTSGVSTSTTYNAGAKLVKDGVMYEVINTVSIKDDGSDDPQTFLNSGDMKVLIKDGTYYSIQNMDITKPGHTGRAWYNSNASINTWQTSYDDTGRPIMEYDDITVGEQIAEDSTITKDKVFYRALQDVTCSGNWATDKSKFEELKTSGAILNRFEANRYYSENEMIIEDNIIYTRKIAGNSGATLGDDIANWEPQTRLHTSGSRHVKFKISTATYPAKTTWAYQNFVYVDGDQSMVGTNTLIAPVDGLYYVHMFPFTVLPSSGSSIIRLSNSVTSQILMTSISGGGTSTSNYVTQSGFDTILHLSKGDTLKVELYYSVKATSSNPSPCEFGLIAEDQSDNIVAEADIAAFTSTTAMAKTPIDLINITNPSVFSSTSEITLPEDGTYIISSDFAQSVGSGVQGDCNIFLDYFNGTSIVSKSILGGTYSQIPSMCHVISGLKGDKFQLFRRKSVSQSGLSNFTKAKVRLIKLKSVTTSLSSQDLYNEYLQRLPSGMTPNSYEDWLKGLISRNQLRVSAKRTTAVTGTSTVKVVTGYSLIDGESAMTDGTKFIAPTAGLYYLHLLPKKTVSSTNFLKSYIYKNTTVINGLPYASNSTGGASMTYMDSLDTFIWLDKDEYFITALWSPDNVDVTVEYLEFGLIQGGHPLENYPNTWEPNVEYDFGNGLYGQRFTGNVTHTAKGTKDILLISGINSLVNSGGVWNRGTDKTKVPVNASITDAGVTSGTIALSCSLNQINSDLTARFLNNGANSSTYDIWIKYTK